MFAWLALRLLSVSYICRDGCRPVQALWKSRFGSASCIGLQSLFRLAEPRAQRLRHGLWSLHGSQMATFRNDNELRMRSQRRHFPVIGRRCQSIVLAAQDQDWARERSKHVNTVLPFNIILSHESLRTKPLGHRPDPGHDVAIGEV